MPIFDAPQDFETELDRVKRAREEIALLRKRNAGREIPEGSMVGKHYVAPHWSQSLLQPIAENVGAGVREGMNEQRAGVLSKAMQAEQEKWLASRPQATAPTELAGPQEEPTDLGQAPQPLMSRAVQPSQQEKLAWAQQGTTNPLSKALAAKFGEDALIHEPIREEARAQQNLTREDTQRQARETLASQQGLAREKLIQEAGLKREALAERERDAIRRSEDSRYSTEQRAQASAELAQVRREAAAAKAEEKAAKASAETPTQSKERQKVEEQVTSAHNRIDALKEAAELVPNSTGSVVGTGVDALLKIGGVSLKGADAIQALKSLEGRLIANGPKYGGAASNQDVKDYKAAAGSLADPTLPRDQRMTALATVQRIAKIDFEHQRKKANEWNTRVGTNGVQIDIPELPPEEPATPQAKPERRQGDRRTASGVIGGMPSDPTAVQTSLQPVPVGKPAVEGTTKTIGGITYVKRNGQWMQQ